MTNTTDSATDSAPARGLIPVDWKHPDFSAVLSVHRAVQMSLTALWDTDSAKASEGWLTLAESYMDKIKSDRIRESWRRVIDQDRADIAILFGE